MVAICVSNIRAQVPDHRKYIKASNEYFPKFNFNVGQMY